MQSNRAVVRNPQGKVVSRWWYALGDYHNIDCLKFRGVQLINNIPYNHYTTQSGVSMYEMAHTDNPDEVDEIKNYFKN